MDRAVDWGFGLSALGWALAGLVEGQARSLVGVTIIVINVVVGLLFLRRRPASRLAPAGECAICVGSVASSAVALSVAPAPAHWPLAAELLFVVAGGVAVVSLLALGSSFGVLPALRGIVRRGPYRMVRHPVYLAELIMVLACGLAARRLLGLWPVALALVLAVVRIGIEERLLVQSQGYDAYQRQVPWRLIPGLW
jgi:protein-S-isoprenylcysteine O-methyltransferase Ste14